MGRTIAVIEDDVTIADAIAARLRSEGFDVVAASDGVAGVELCASASPDLVVLDLMLPGLDGLEVCRRIQADRPVPVIILTARDDETDLLVGLAVGADDYLTKPFSPRELVARIHALFRRIDATAAGAQTSAATTRPWSTSARCASRSIAGACCSTGSRFRSRRPSTTCSSASPANRARREPAGSCSPMCGTSGTAPGSAPSTATSERSVASWAPR